MLEINQVSFDDLTEEEQQDQPSNGSGKEEASYLRITYDGKTIALHSDAMEPEDCIFPRGLSWVAGAIRKAYELGKHDS